MDWDFVDWLHVISNGAGVLGDAVTIVVALAGPLCYVGVAAAATGANAVNISIDVYGVFAKNDYQSVTLDALQSAAQQVNAGKNFR